LSLLILLVGMPAYIALAWWVMSLFERPGIWLEFAIYIVLGILWVLPFKAVFKGVGQADPDAPRDE
jgi:hypothetical protein